MARQLTGEAGGGKGRCVGSHYGMGHLRVTVGHLMVTVGHLRVTVVHLRVTIGHPRVTFFYKQT